MRKIKTINFLQEYDKEEKYFTCLLLILSYLLILQGVSYIKSIKTLEEEIIQIKTSTIETQQKEVEFEKSTLLQDTKEVYDILGNSNVDSINIKNNRVQLEGKCEDLKVLDKLNNMKNVRKVSINSVEKENDTYLFKVVYQIGGAD